MDRLTTLDAVGRCLLFVYLLSGMCRAAATCEYATGFSLLEGQSASTPAAMAQPAKGEWYSDPVHGTCCVRVTDEATEGPRVFARQDYSRRQTFNVDDTRILIGADGSGWWHLYDGQTFACICELSELTGAADRIAGDAECYWSPTSPDTLYFSPTFGGLVIYRVDINTKAVTVAADFTDVKGVRGRPGETSVKTVWPDAARCWTKAEGSPSADGRFWGLMVMTDAHDFLGFMVYDMAADSIIATRAETEGADHCSMSLSGRWLVAGSNYTTATRFYPQGLDTFFVIYDDPCHSDLALNEAGEDIYFYVQESGGQPTDYTGWITSYNLDTGERIKYFPIWGGGLSSGDSPAYHFSGRSYDRPGWCLVSSYLGSSGRWDYGRIMAVELKPDGRLLNIAHTYNAAGSYFAETQATVNRDFTKVLWASNWNTAGEENVETYLCRLDPGLVPNGGGTAAIPNAVSAAVRAPTRSFTLWNGLRSGADPHAAGQLFDCRGRRVSRIEGRAPGVGIFVAKMAAAGR